MKLSLEEEGLVSLLIVQEDVKEILYTVNVARMAQSSSLLCLR